MSTYPKTSKSALTATKVLLSLALAPLMALNFACQGPMHDIGAFYIRESIEVPLGEVFHMRELTRYRVQGTDLELTVLYAYAAGPQNGANGPRRLDFAELQMRTAEGSTGLRFTHENPIAVWHGYWIEHVAGPDDVHPYNIPMIVHPLRVVEDAGEPFTVTAGEYIWLPEVERVFAVDFVTTTDMDFLTLGQASYEPGPVVPVYLAHGMRSFIFGFNVELLALDAEQGSAELLISLDPTSPAAVAPVQAPHRSRLEAVARPGPGSADRMTDIEFIDAAFAGLTFTFDARLGQAVQGEATEAFGGPARLLRFGEGQSCTESGYLAVYPVEALARWQGPGPQPTTLQAALNRQADEFPTWGAAILVRAQTHPIAFQNGRGLRALVMHGQDAFLANNEALIYDYHGLTDDGRYYVHFCYPVAAPMLLDSHDPAENRNPLALTVPSLGDDVERRYELMRQYNQQAAAALDVLGGSAFQPDPVQLDALIDSLRVDPAP